MFLLVESESEFGKTSYGTAQADGSLKADREIGN